MRSLISQPQSIPIKTTQALVAGGLTVIEVVLRTSAAIDSLAEVVRAVPDAIVGAGTVLSERQAGEVAFAGAKFIVSPGLYAPVVEYAQAAGLPIFPGVATASTALLPDCRASPSLPVGLFD